MARSPRIFFPDAIYHVYCRTARGEKAFSDLLEAREFVKTVADVKRLHGFRLFAWCLMGNHYHLVIQSRAQPLWRSMARIQCRVARGYNHRHRLLGRLWQSRYKARLVRDDIYYQQLLAYVHLNPVAARIVEDPAAYEWSGHAALIGIRPPVLVDRHAALRGFGETPKIAREIYLDQVRNVAEARWLDGGVRDLPWWENVPNDEQFADPAASIDGFDHRGEPVRIPPTRRLNLTEALALVCDATGITEDELRGRSRSAEAAAARRAFSILAVEQLGHSVGDVAVLLNKHPGSVSRWLETSRCINDPCDQVPSEMALLTSRIRGIG